MSGLEVLQSVQFVTAKGKRLAVLRAEDWEALIEWLETLEDVHIARQALADLQAANGDRQRAGWEETAHMSTETTSIQVEPDIANAYNSAPQEDQKYNSAPQEDQKKIQLLMGLWLRELSTQPNMSLIEVMDMISDQAQARGLTPEILESILNEGSFALCI